jgi:hypothetical protein
MFRRIMPGITANSQRVFRSTGSVDASIIGVLLCAGVACADTSEPPTPATIPTLVEDLRLDADAENFSSVSRVLVGSRGEIVVPLWQDAQIRMYDSTGKRIAAVGRRGPGPGEFESIGPMGWSADTLWVSEIQRRRFTYIAPDGTILRHGTLPGPLAMVTPFTPAAGLGMLWIEAIYPDGSMLGNGSSMRVNAKGRREVGAPFFLGISRTGEWRPLLTLPPGEDERWHMVAGGLGRAVPFAAAPVVVIASDGRRIAFLTTEITSDAGGTYTLSVFRDTGDTMFVRSYPFVGTRIPQAAKDSAVAAEAPRPGEVTEGPGNLTAQFQRLARERMPPVYAPVRSLVFGLDETIWITLRDSGDVRRTLVLDGRGDQVGTVTTSTRTTIRQASTSHVWATEVDDDGLASVVRYRVSGLACGDGKCR